MRWDMEIESGKPPTKQQQKRLESLQREIAALQDTTGDRARELEKSAYITARQYNYKEHLNYGYFWGKIVENEEVLQ